MIFNKDFNRTLTLVNTSNKDFKEIYKSIIGIVPNEVTIFTKKNEDIKIDIPECSYDYFSYKNNYEQNLRFIINDHKEDYGIFIILTTINEKTLNEISTKKSILSIATIAIQNKGSSLEYIVELQPINEYNYELITKKIIDQDYDNVIIEKDILTHDELIKKLNLNMNKR